MLVCILDTAIVLVFEGVVFAVGIGVAALPECLDELITLLIVRELHERLALIIGDDPAYVLVKPGFVFALELSLQRLGVFPLAFLVDWALQRVSRITALVSLGFVGLSLLICGTGAGKYCGRQANSHNKRE